MAFCRKCFDFIDLHFVSEFGGGILRDFLQHATEIAGSDKGFVLLF